jgi:hypothetical protein
VIYSYGTVLLDLLSGKHIPPSHVSATSKFHFSWVECSSDDVIRNSIIETFILCMVKKKVSLQVKA